MKRFPLRFFLKTLIWQAFVTVLVFCAIYLIFDLKLDVLIIFCLILLTSQIFLAFRITKSYQIVLSKAFEILDKDFFKSPLVQDDLLEESDLFLELEKTLTLIYKKLKRKSIQIFQQKEESEAFLSAVEDSVVIVDLNEKIVFFNSYFGVSFINQEAQKEQLTLTQVFRTPEIISLFSKTLKDGSHQKKRLSLPVLTSPHTHYFSVHVTPLKKTTNGELYGALGFFHDINDLKKAEQIRIEFVSNASHELRTPLTSVKGYVETLKDDVKNGRLDTASQFLDIISRNVNRLTDLVNDLLTISTLDSHSDLTIDDVNTLHVSHHVIEQLSMLAREKKQSVHLISDAGIFKADVRKVEQVLLNLVNNAIKYIPENKKIEIIWKRDLQNITLCVRDNGPGISEEHLERLFERFYRIDKGRTRDVGGTGLGLAIVKHMMQAHGGQIAIKSKIGEGTEFTCTFPIHDK